MPPDREDPQRREREQADQGSSGRAHRLMDAVRHERGRHADEPLGGAPRRIVRREAGAGERADAVGQQQHETRAERGRSAPRETAEALECRERPTEAQQRHHRGAGAERPPQQRSDAVAPAPGDGKAQQRESEEQPDDEGADADPLLARFGVHVVRRSAEVGTTPNRSGLAAKATSSARSTSPSWWAASEPSSASAQPGSSSVSARAARAASFRTSLRRPFFAALITRPAM